LKLYLPLGLGLENIRIENHKEKYLEAIKVMKNITPIPFDGNIALEHVLNTFQKNIPRTISELETPAILASWAGEYNKAMQYVNWAEEIFKTWAESAQEYHGGKNWRANLVAKIEKPKELREITRQEVIKHKLEKVPYQDFTDVAYKEGPIAKEG